MRNKIRRWSLVIAILSGILLLSACGRDEEPQQQETTLPPVEISMPEYELHYSGQWKDIIRTKEVITEEKVGLQFSVLLSVGETPIFTLYYDSDEAELVTVLTDAKGNQIPVAFEMNTVPDNLGENDANTFYQAQDAVNEILDSLVLK
jgi:hypothetical protein